MKPDAHGKSYFIGEYKQMVNGNIVDDVSIESTYDGNKMHIDKRDNNVVSHLTIKNNQLHNLLNNSTSQENLFDRLSKDFNVKRMNIKYVGNNKKTKRKGKSYGKRKTKKPKTKKNNKRNNRKGSNLHH